MQGSKRTSYRSAASSLYVYWKQCILQLCRYPYTALAGCTQSPWLKRIADQDEPVCYPSQGEMRRLEGQVQQEKQQSLKAVQSERRRQKSQVDAANAKAVASESEVASLRKAVEALQHDLDACRREAAQLKAPAQVSPCRRLTPFYTAPLPGNMLCFCTPPLLYCGACLSCSNALAARLASDLLRGQDRPLAATSLYCDILMQALPEPFTQPVEPVTVQDEQLEPPPQAQPAQAAPVQEEEGAAMEEDAAPAAVAPPMDMPSQPTVAEAPPQPVHVEPAQQEAEAPVQPSTTAPPAEPVQADVVTEAATPVSLTVHISASTLTYNKADLHTAP